MSKKHTSRALVTSADTGSLTELEQVLRAFRAATGLEVCFKLLKRDQTKTDMEALSDRHGLHQSEFCTEVKRTRNERCKECDLRYVPARCERERTIFSHTCHAGADEVIIPLFSDEALVAVAYVGQFRTGDDQPLELPLLSVEKLEQIEGLSRLLASYFSERLRTLRFVSQSSSGFRNEAIRRFLEINLRENPSLTDLARHLGLSTTRTAHAVRETTGNSFVELRDGLRMGRAKGLLQGTYFKVAHVAAECGFASPQYFHRFFKRQCKATPLAFRKKSRPEP
ncbi:MAG: helix-turn-helix domain-containing protein [Opitutaceae bacterium]|jgi:AraC-like DNA-binding protein